MRLFWVQGGVVSNNRLKDAPFPRVLLKLHAPGRSTAGIGFHQYTEKVVLSDNLFDGTGGTQIPVDIGPENDTSDERSRLIVYERNYITTGPAVQQCTNISCSQLSVRYNIFNMGTARDAIYTRKKGVEPSPSDVWVHQNTCLSTHEERPGRQQRRLGHHGPLPLQQSRRWPGRQNDHAVGAAVRDGHRRQRERHGRGGGLRGWGHAELE